MITMKLLESQDPNDWQENSIDTQLRQNIEKTSSPVLIRQLYPLQARLLVKCPFSHKPIGYVYRYARTTWAPSMYPIQALDLEGTTKHQWCYNSSEVEILPGV